MASDPKPQQPSDSEKYGAEHQETILAEPGLLSTVSYGQSGIRGLFSSKAVFGPAVLASLGGFSMGYDMGVISIINVMDSFHKTFPPAVTAFGTEFMTAMLLLGAFIGCIFMPYLADRYSRKWALTVVVVIFDIGAILQTAAPNYATLVAGRFIGGIGVGTLAMVLYCPSLGHVFTKKLSQGCDPQGAPLYISEISPPNFRGTLLVLESISITGGVVIAFWITFATRHIAGEASFRLPFGLQMVTATLLGAGIHFFPYSPRWLALVNRRDECLRSLSRLRGLPQTDGRVQAELLSILAEVNFQSLVQAKRHPGATGIKLEILCWLDLFHRKNWRRTAVGCGVALFQQFSGINAFIYYAPTLFRNLGQSDEQSLILSGVFNILQLVAAVVCFFIIERVGRRTLAILGGFITATAYTIIAVLSGLYDTDWTSHLAAGWAAVAMAFVFILIYGVSYSPLGWALPPEVFSNATRSKGVALSTCTIWLCDFIVGISVPTMIQTIGYRTYIFFAVMCFLAGVWAILLVPETSGKSLEEMDEVFGDVTEQEESELVREAALTARSHLQASV